MCLILGQLMASSNRKAMDSKYLPSPVRRFPPLRASLANLALSSGPYVYDVCLLSGLVALTGIEPVFRP